MTQQPQTEKNHRLIKTLSLLTALFIAIGLIVLLLWLTRWRYEETTDDAYVHGNSVTITSQVSAKVTSYFVDNTNFVEAGQLLVLLDRHDFEIALEQKLGNLGQTVRQVRQLIEQTQEQKALLEQKRYEFDRLKLEHNRRKTLVGIGAVAEEDYSNALLDMDQALARVIAQEHHYNALLATSQVTKLIEHPLVVSGIQSVKQAYLDLSRTKIYAPVSGYIAQRTVQVGQLVDPNDILLWIIPYDQVWVDANFKETQLANIRIGQPVELISDMYGAKTPFHGSIVGIGAGTGSVFSILPPQNATGNWIKIVQRVPVKVSLTPSEVKNHPLSLGLSMTVRVDTHDHTYPRVNSQKVPSVVQHTTIYDNELQGVDELIEKVLVENGANLS